MIKKILLWIFVYPLYLSFAGILVVTQFSDDEKLSDLGGALLIVSIPLVAILFHHIHIRRPRLKVEKAETAEAEKVGAEAAEKAAAKAEKQRKAEAEKARKANNAKEAKQLIADLDEFVMTRRKEILDANRATYESLLNTVKEEQETVSDIRKRHPDIGSYLATRSEKDSDNPTFQELKALFD